MKINIILEENAKLPTKAHDTDAGFDLYTPENHVLKAHKSLIIDTGVHMNIPKGYVGFIKSKSGLNIKYNITAEGVIDSGYTGSIVVKLYNNSDEHYIFNKGDKITQIVILPIPKSRLKTVNTFKTTKRGNKGFGSSGK